MQGAGGDDSLRVITSPCPHSIALVHQRWGWCLVSPVNHAMLCFLHLTSVLSPKGEGGKTTGSRILGYEDNWCDFVELPVLGCHFLLLPYPPELL